MGKDKKGSIEYEKLDLAEGVEIEVPKSLNINTLEDLITALKEKPEESKKINIKIDSVEAFYKAFGEAIRKDYSVEARLAGKVTSSLMYKNDLPQKDSPIHKFCKEYGISIFDIDSTKIGDLKNKLKEDFEEEDFVELLKDDSVKFIVVSGKTLAERIESVESKELKNKLEKALNDKSKMKESERKREPNQQTEEQNKPKQQPIKQDEQKQDKSKQHTQDTIEINKLDKRGIKKNKKILDKYLIYVTQKYGRETAISKFQQYYSNKGEISEVEIPGGKGKLKKHEFKGEARALKVLIARYVEYALNYGKGTKSPKIEHLKVLLNKDIRLKEKIISMYEEKVKKNVPAEQILEEIVQKFTDYIRADDETRKKDTSMQIEDVTDMDLIEIIVSSEIDNLMENEKNKVNPAKVTLAKDKEFVDKYLMAVTKRYGRDATILAFQQYYSNKGEISEVEIPGGKGKLKKHEFKGEARALNVLIAKYVEYALNFGKETDPAKIKNFYDLPPKERRIIEKIVSMYADKTPEEIVHIFTSYIRADDERRKKDEDMQIQGVTDMDLIEIVVSSQIDNLMEKEKVAAKAKGEEPTIKKTEYEEKIDSFNTSSGNIQMSAVRYVSSIKNLTDDKEKKSAKANVQANMSLLLNRLVNSVDDKDKTSISIIPDIDIEKLKKEFEIVNSKENTSSDPDNNSKDEAINSLQEQFSRPFGLEPVKFDKKLSPWEKNDVADKYLQRAATTYLSLKNMIEETRANIAEMKSKGENVEEHEKLVEKLISIYDRMMENGNDKLISQYIALSEARNQLQRSPEAERRPPSHDSDDKEP